MGLLRVLLALSVLAGHSSPVLGTSLIGGGIAVKLFFVVSGFYIALILTAKYTDIKLFYTNRILRLYPAYLTVLIVSIGWFYFTWLYIGHRPPPAWIAEAYNEMPIWQAVALRISNISMVGLDLIDLFHYRLGEGFLLFHCNCAVDAPDGAHWASHFNIIAQAWSISSELWFYLLAPFLVKRSFYTLIIIMIVSFGTYIWMEQSELPPYFFFLAQLAFFVVGILVYKIYQAKAVSFDNSKIGPYLLGLIILIFFFFEKLPSAASAYVVWAACLLALPWLFSYFKRNAWDTRIGNLSYPIYLSHALIIAVMASIFRVNDGNIIAIVTILFSAAIYLIIEAPIDRFRQRRLKGPAYKESPMEIERVAAPIS